MSKIRGIVYIMVAIGGIIECLLSSGIQPFSALGAGMLLAVGIDIIMN